MSNTPPSVWVIGSSNVDLIMKMARLPELGETVTDGEFIQTFGGKGANSAVACARAGAPTVFLNAVGNDPYAKTLLDNLAEAGVDTHYVRQEADCPSGHALVMIGDSGDNYLSVAPGANYRLLPEHVLELENKLASATRILIQNEIPPETNRAVREIASRYDIPVSWNFAPAIAVDPAAFQALDTLIVNETEADAIATACGLEALANQPERMVEALRSLGPRCAVLTLGKDGVVAAIPGKTIRIPALQVEAVDATGAGDTFCGALAASLSVGQPFQDALAFATAAGSLAVTKLGAQPSCPHRDDILKAIRPL